jgi:hypothetical protein
MKPWVISSVIVVEVKLIVVFIVKILEIFSPPFQECHHGIFVAYKVVGVK